MTTSQRYPKEVFCPVRKGEIQALRVMHMWEMVSSTVVEQDVSHTVFEVTMFCRNCGRTQVEFVTHDHSLSMDLELAAMIDGTDVEVRHVDVVDHQRMEDEWAAWDESHCLDCGRELLMQVHCMDNMEFVVAAVCQHHGFQYRMSAESWSSVREAQDAMEAGEFSTYNF